MCKRMYAMLLYCVFIIFVGIPGYAAGVQKSPPGSFVRHRVSNPAQLAHEAAIDTRAMRLYAQHFRISENKVVPLLKSLRLGTLKKSVRAVVWYVDRTGKVRSKFKMLPQGTLVFTDGKGTPMIVWSCGNPMTRRLPAPQSKRHENVKSPAGPEPTFAAGNESEVIQPPVPEPVVAMAPVEKVLSAPFEEILPPSPAMAEVLASAPISITTPPSVTDILAPALGSAILVASIPGITGSLSSGEDSSRLVPEPSCLVAIGCGLVLLTGRMRRMKI